MTNPFGDPEKARQALLSQKIFSGVEGCNEISSKIMKVWKIKKISQGEILINQDELNDDFYFILNGAVSVLINGNLLSQQRKSGETVGEVAFVNSGIKRTATVIATEDTWVGTIKFSDFRQIINDCGPILWNLLSVVTERLAQRNTRERKKNQKPKLFLGSSTESQKILEVLQKELNCTEIDIVSWNVNTFRFSKYTLEDLVKQAGDCDFAIMIFGKDDRTLFRKKWFFSPRDNVVFELGLFMGALGTERAFVVQPNDRKLKLPSDLFELTTCPFKDLEHLSSEAKRIKRHILEMGSR